MTPQQLLEKVSAEAGYSDIDLDLLRLKVRQAAGKDAPPDALAQLIRQAHKSGLDALTGQIMLVKRSTNDEKDRSKPARWRDIWSVQTSIDGLRAIADRTGCYAPGGDTVFTESAQNGTPYSVTVYVKKFVRGTWHEYGATAFFREYNAPNNSLWKKMEWRMLEKCAEALCLRRGFPQLTGIYIYEEMHQADQAPAPAQQQQQEAPPARKQRTPEEQAALVEKARARVLELGEDMLELGIFQEAEIDMPDDWKATVEKADFLRLVNWGKAWRERLIVTVTTRAAKQGIPADELPDAEKGETGDWVRFGIRLMEQDEQAEPETEETEEAEPEPEAELEPA